MERENLVKTGTNGNEKVRARFTLKLCEPSYDGFARSLRIWVLTTFRGGYFISLLRKLHGSFASVQEGEHSSPASLSCGICNRQMLHRNHEDQITDIILHFPKHPPPIPTVPSAPCAWGIAWFSVQNTPVIWGQGDLPLGWKPCTVT